MMEELVDLQTLVFLVVVEVQEKLEILMDKVMEEMVLQVLYQVLQ
jgi:hypothetical protein